jgi:hypothetical protein
MMLMYPGPDNEGPTPEAIARMARYNEELEKAGALLSLDGLHPPSNAASVSFSGESPTVTDGPFTEAKELVGGYWIIQAESRDQAIDWAARCPAGAGDRIEIRQLAEISDYPEG